MPFNTRQFFVTVTAFPSFFATYIMNQYCEGILFSSVLDSFVVVMKRNEYFSLSLILKLSKRENKQANAIST